MSEKVGVFACSDLSDSADDGAGHIDDRANLVLQDDSDDEDDDGGMLSSSKSARKKKYTVSETRNIKHLPAWCQPQRLSRNERICLVVGSITLVAIVVVFVSIAVATPAISEKSETQGTNGSGGGESGGNGSGGGKGTELMWSDVRLQSSVIPDYYDVSIFVNLDTFQVTGSVSISCTVTSSVDYIALHVKDMNISDGHSVTRDGRGIEHNKVWYTDNDFFIFNLTQHLSPGPITLSMSFSYILRGDLAGFYRSSYVDAQGTTRYLATTQFEPTDARRAFPCFDEPSLKANFTIQITHQSRYSAWSNMPIKSRTTENSNGFVTTKFETSVRMSSYLVAFIVSDFACIGEAINSTSGKEVMVSRLVGGWMDGKWNQGWMREWDDR